MFRTVTQDFFLKKIVGIFRYIIHTYTEFHEPNYSASSVIAIKRNSKYRFQEAAAILLHRIFSWVCDQTKGLRPPPSTIIALTSFVQAAAMLVLLTTGNYKYSEVWVASNTVASQLVPRVKHTTRSFPAWKAG
jgi:hypothetical protein